MPLSPSQKIDLINTDPRWVGDYNYYLEPDDHYLWLQLGWDYSRYLRLRRDAHISAQLQKRRQSVVGRSLIVEPFDDSRKAKKATEVVDRLLKKMDYEKFCLRLLEIGQLTGFCAFKVDYEHDRTSDLIIPRLEFVPNHRWTFTPVRPDDRSPYTVTDEVLEPDEVAIFDNYELRLLTRRSPTLGERVPKERFLLYSFGGTTPWGLGLGYQCYPLSLIKEEARKAFLLMGDRLGNPPVLGEHPPSLDADTENNRRIRAAWHKFLKSIAPNAWVDVSPGFKATLLEAQSSLSPDVHDRLIEHCNTEISKAILGEVPISDRRYGSRGANESQVEDRESSLTDADCNLLDEQLKAFWTRLVELNAPGCPAPIVRRSTEADKRVQEQDAAKLDANLKQAQRDEILIRAGLKPSDEYIQETYGDGWELAEEAEESPFGTPIAEEGKDVEVDDAAALPDIGVPEALEEPEFSEVDHAFALDALQEVRSGLVLDMDDSEWVEAIGVLQGLVGI